MRLLALLGLAAALGACATGPGDTPDNPIRLERPADDAILRDYPPAALAQHVSGRVVVECIVNNEALLDNCLVESEMPQGYGFGDAAIRLAFEHRVLPSNGGAIPIGERVSFPVEFRAPN